MKAIHTIASCRGDRTGNAMPCLRIGLAAVLSILALTTSVVRADFYNTHVSEENATSPDPTPVDSSDPSQGWNWPNPPWSLEGPAQLQTDGLTITGSLAAGTNGIVIGAGNFRLFGMDNWHIPTNVKTYTVEFDYNGGNPTFDGAESGFHPQRNYTGYPVGQRLEEVDTGNHFKLVYKFTPQPDWEYIKIRNTGAAPMTIVGDISFKSVCPEPGSLSLLALGGMGLIRRRLHWR